MTSLEAIGEAAKKAAYALEGCNCKNKALIAIANSLEARADEILAANAIDNVATTTTKVESNNALVRLSFSILYFTLPYYLL